ncbi:MAG: hypothetical protein JNK87_32730 [Bryobacterales bacterium]|nr:hypothetical protein [Bryobacterales bacterium]
MEFLVHRDSCFLLTLAQLARLSGTGTGRMRQGRPGNSDQPIGHAAG